MLHLRKTRPILVLLLRIASWIASLPPKARPHPLVAQFARIANFIRAMWADPPACRAYFDELFLDRRGGRKGFPAPLLRGLRDICADHAFVDAYPGCNWDWVKPKRKL